MTTDEKWAAVPPTTTTPWGITIRRADGSYREPTYDEVTAMLAIANDRREKIAMLNDDAFEHGYWHACSGCHESNEGHPTGPYSEALDCTLGLGCFECGGIGAVWEQADMEAP